MATINTVGAGSVTGVDPGIVAAAAAGPTTKDVQDRFLTLLVTQMRNQDPLNPLDNAQLTTQLAQISTVTGVDQMHQTIKAMLDQIKSLESLQAANMDGKDVLVAGDQIQLAPERGTGGAFALSEPADMVTITIKSEAGIPVREIQLARQLAGTHRFEWDGLTSSGARAADGLYTVSVSATAGGSPINATTFGRAHVESIVRGGQSVQVDLGLLGRRPLSDVVEIL